MWRESEKEERRMGERCGEASFLQTAEEVWLQSETEVRRERGRCREDVGDGEIEAREGGGVGTP